MRFLRYLANWDWIALVVNGGGFVCGELSLCSVCFNILIVLTSYRFSKKVNFCDSWEEVVFYVHNFILQIELTENVTKICEGVWDLVLSHSVTSTSLLFLLP